MLIFAGIDGTGPSDNIAYMREFRTSHVSVLARNWGGSGPSMYLRGPSDLGFQTRDLADGATAFVEAQVTQARAQKQRTGVFLAGYSRGGAAMLNACAQLYFKNIVVDCLLLFDAVDRTNTVSTNVVAGNVRACYHALRDPYTFSRGWFGNCGRATHSGATQYRERDFHCTHGAVGGLPWKTGNSSGAVEESKSWMFPTLGNRGVAPPSQSLLASLIMQATAGLVGAGTATTVTPQVDGFGAQQVWSWIQAGLQQEIAGCQQRLADPNPPPWPPRGRGMPGHGGGPAIGNSAL